MGINCISVFADFRHIGCVCSVGWLPLGIEIRRGDGVTEQINKCLYSVVLEGAENVP